MKQHLVNLLYIQSKLYEIFEEEEIDYDEDTFDNFGVVLDIIGFPKDNADEYDSDGQLGTPYDSTKGKLMDDDLFSRDYLYQHFSEVISDSTQKVGNDETLIKEQFSNFVNWLYKELENIKEEKRQLPDIGLN
jgi:hypothetical protein